MCIHIFNSLHRIRRELRREMRLAKKGFNPSEHWRKPNTLLHKGEYALAQFDDGRYEIVSRIGTGKWKAMGGWNASGKVVRVMILSDIPSSLWDWKYKNGTKSVQHPITKRWIDTKFLK